MSEGKTIGFITGGQLGKMMIESFLPIRRNEKIFVLDSEKNCPCANLADEVFLGSSKNYDDVLEFGKKCDTIILEFEHVNIDALFELEKMGKNVFCQPKHLKIIQNKGLQKKFLEENNIPTAKFFTVKNKADFIAKKTEKKYPFPLIQKTFFDGYDGGGVQKISSQGDIEKFFDAPSILEECVNIQKEFSCICGRDRFGTEFFYPLVEQFFHEKTHIVDIVVSPAKISKEIQVQVENIAKKILTQFDGIGIWAIELFEDENQKILVNEIAPRVHNSGHASIEGNKTSQFSQYMRICLGYTAGITDITQNSICYNLLGEEGHTGKTQYKGLKNVLQIPEVYPHFYGKMSTKPHRKMGHVTVQAETEKECWEKISQVKNTLSVIAE